ncbi:GAF domain-containing protein [Plantactinospora veratri]
MIEIKKMTGTKEENYALALKQVQAMIHGEPNLIANLSNVSSIINQALSDINWVGFYLLEKETNQLVLGPSKVCLRAFAFH